LVETVTHARLRAQQGDRAGALRILEAILARRPGDPAATALLRDLPGGPSPEPEPAEAPLAPPTAAGATELAGPFRRALEGDAVPPPRGPRQRLQRFLHAVSRHAR
jgi:hypothetical protein